MALENLTNVSTLVTGSPVFGDEGLKMLAAALAVAIPAMATGKAQASIGAAGMGAMAENEGLSGKVIILLALPETAVILGFVVAVLMLFS